MPCTRALLQSTMIGASVGRLRKHGDSEVNELASRIVLVWKAQLAEQKLQQQVGGSAKGRRR